VIDLASRRVQILGSTANPAVLFMQQVVRTLTMAQDGEVRAPSILICDRDRREAMTCGVDSWTRESTWS
jgi:hypothetical protein